ncbi:MAG: DoxX family protein [Planctomycetota bacterium]
MALAVFAEFFCAALVVLGLGTRLALIPLITTMLVAMLLVHGADPWPKKEPAFVYLVMFGTLFLCGPGRWSLDAQLVERLKAKKAEE